MGEFFKRKDGKQMAKPNLNAPRERVSRYSVLNIKMFHKYQKAYPDSDLTWEQFKAIIEKSNSIFTYYIMQNRDGIELPNMLGHMFIGACPKDREFNYDYTKSGEIEQEVHHKNFDSNQYLCKIFYSSYETKYKFRFRDAWYFRGTRLFKRAVSKEFKANWGKYIKISHFKKITKQMKEEGVRSIKINKYERKGRRIDLSDTQHH